MSFIKLTLCGAGGSTGPMYVNPDHIVTMTPVWVDRTHIELSNDPNVFVVETPEQIAELTSAAFETDLPISWSDWGRLQEFLNGLYTDKAYQMPADRLGGQK